MGYDIVCSAWKHAAVFKRGCFSETTRTYGCEANSELWNAGGEANKTTVRQRKRKLSYISNILVVSDSKNPENEGKVMLFKYGAKIFDKISEALDPPEPAEGDDPVEACNIFDLEEGANFKFRIRKVDGQTNYDKSEFDKPSAVEGDAETLMSGAEDLNQFIAPEKFKKYDQIKARLDLVLGKTTKPVQSQDEDSDSDAEFARKAAKAAASKPAKVVSEDEGEEDDMEVFRRLAEED